MLRARGLTVRYDEVLALDDVDLDSGSGITAVIGPSGSGKTTLLRALAGLEPLARGTITWGDTELTTIAPHRRGLGLMFQDHALFEGRNVRGNVDFGLQMARHAAAERRARTDEMLDLVGLAHLGDRSVDQLSGGEQQRVALARALAPGPRLLMLDEPLASVDRERRDQLARDLARILRSEAIPTLLVTHDLDEAFTLADSVVILDQGRVIQTGATETVWRAPATAAVGGFLGVVNWLDRPAAAGQVTTPWGAVPTRLAGTARVGFRAADLRIDPAGEIGGSVTAVWFRRDHYEVEVDCTIGALRATVRTRVSVGEPVRVTADLAAAVVVAE